MRTLILSIIFLFSIQASIFADYNTALTHFQNNDYQASLQSIAQVLVIENDSDPTSDNFKLRYLAGHCLWKMNNYDRAMIHFRKSIELQPDNINLYIDCALMMLDAKRNSDALSFANKIIEKDQSEPLAYYVLGGVYYNQKNYEKSKQNYEKALSLDPEMYACWNGLGKLLYATHKYSESITAFSTALAMNSSSAESENNLALAYYKTNKYDLAKEHIEKAKDLDPDSSYIKMNYKIIYASNN